VSVGKLQILHGGEERCGLRLDSLRERLPGARPKDVRQGIIALAPLTKPGNVTILVHGVSFSVGDSGRFDRHPDTPPFSNRHHTVSCVARTRQAFHVSNRQNCSNKPNHLCSPTGIQVAKQQTQTAA
jgi:hypothetical protein